MKNLQAALLASAAIAICAAAPAGAATAAETAVTQAVQEETARLNEWFEARWNEQLDMSPLSKTYLGLKDDNDKVDDASEAELDRQLRWLLGTVDEMRAEFDYDLLSADAQVSYDLYAYQAKQQEEFSRFRRRDYLFHQLDGPHTSLPGFLINFHGVDNVADMEAYITRVGGISHAVSQSLERAQLAASEGARPPRFAYDAVIQQAGALIAGAPFDDAPDSPLWADAKRKIESLEQAGTIDAEEAKRLREAAQKALIEEFAPAYKSLIAWFESDKQNADAKPRGVSALPQGRAYYKQLLAGTTTTDMTANEIHELGLSEVARIRKEMEAIKEAVGFEGTLEDFFAFFREDEQFFYPNTDKGREDYLEASRAHLENMKKKLPDYFGILPKADVIVKRVEPFREQDGGPQHYFNGAKDGSRPGIVYVHLSDMAAMPIPQMEVITYHEGIPGHHMQSSIAQEMESIPTFRAQANSTAYDEGWALYAEKLAEEMGAYGDPYSNFGRLTTEIWRAIRLVLDTGIHSKGWSEERAVEYFKANSPAADAQIRSEVQRYFVIPSQATAYKIGMIKIQELRAKAESALGDDFDIRAFHDTILGGGALPLEILERRVDDWIASEKAS